MPKDALTIYRAACELDMLVGGRVDKVTMPDKDTIILLVHTSHGNHRLLLSCNPSLPRAHITAAQYKNPDTATGLLMYFRKRLTGAALTAIGKYQSERMIAFEFSALNELRERVCYTLYAELTGKCANIIFTDAAGIIGNALRKVSAEAPGKRAVLIGLPYSLPNPTGRISVFQEAELLTAAAATGCSPRDAINKCVAGLSPATVDEIFVRSGANGCELPQAVALFCAEARARYSAPLQPTATFDGDKPLDYYPFTYATAGGDARRYPTLNAAMDDYYSRLFAAAELAAYVKPLRAAVKAASAKNAKRLSEAVAKLAECERADDDKKRGDLVTANIYRIRRGDSAVTVEDFYDGGTVTIPLDITKNAQQNAAAAYKSYSKKKKAAVYARDAEQKAREALFVLDGLSAELDLCTNKRELDEVRDELVSLGLLKPDGKRKKEKPTPSEPYTFDIMGATLLVGKNHAQNDRITRGAARTDTWLHVKSAHGCHAVLKTPSPTPEQIVRAAEIAAYYSRSRGADKADVDYTQIKFVYTKGGGHVDYKEYKTVTVTPRA